MSEKVYNTFTDIVSEQNGQEDNSRIERLIEFKVVYGKSLAEVRNCLDKFFPEMTVQDKQNFIFSFYVRNLPLYGGDRKTEGSNDAGKRELCIYVGL